MSEQYLPRVSGGRWAISRLVERRWIALVEDSYLDDPADAEVILKSIDVAPTLDNLNRYFPMIEKRGRCPTLELLELFSRVGNKIKKEYGV